MVLVEPYYGEPYKYDSSWNGDNFLMVGQKIRDGFIGRSKVESVSMELTVIRANGDREDIGVVGYWHRKPLQRLLYNLRRDPWSWLRPVNPFAATLQVNAGRGIVTARLRAVGTEPLNIGWGTGAGTTAAADTTLFTEVLVSMAAGGTDHTVGTSSQQTTTTTNDTYRVTGTRTATASGTITNAGLFDAASGGTLFMKGDFAGIALVNGDAIAFTMNIQYS